ncbi:MAG: beta-mannosidase [Gammaproteobacteria bacterium]|nr:MAG: beta-mannosidase [Gammaproteobacteria bacterium]
MNKLKFKKLSVTLSTAAIAGMLLAANAFAGWSVSGTKIIDPKGNNFIFRGINHAHVWYTSRTEKALTDIAATGANSVRVVLGDGGQWTRTPGSEVATIISQCKAAKLVCVLEVHDSTGFGESSAATNISNAANYWASADIKNAIIGQEDYVIVNIANEPYGNNTSAATYTSETSAAIKTIRNAGLTHLIMVDAPAWGQDWQNIMRDNAATIFAADSLANTMFSVHMYEVYNSASVIQNYLTTFQAKGYALIVGEFGTENNGNNVDEASILQITQSMGIGYMGWSWSGNGSCCVPLDIAVNWDPAALSTWGNFLINSANGIKATSKLATIFTGTSTSSSSVKSSSSSSVKSSSSSVAVSSSSSSIKSSSSSSVAFSSSSIAGGEQCNWYGTLYPVCATTSSGWGYENGKSCIARSTCAAQPAPYGVVGNSSASSVASSSVKTSSSVAVSSSSKSSSSTATTSSSSKSSVASSSSSSVAATGLSCSYVVTNSWGTGYTGAVRVTNNGTSAISSWTASWQFSGANRITSTWNANVSGSNPYSANNLNWNGSIAVGQTVEFGFQGNTNGGSIETPAVSCK